MVEFTIVGRSEGAYNDIIGRPVLSQFKDYGDPRQPEDGERMLPSLHKVHQGARGEPEEEEPHEDVRNVLFDEKDPAKVFKIGTTLGLEHE
ncbi:hypothetical protein LIER_20322 [Lithospermum erythrorhizon]|uniref:Uncharacterized protein n=1 Tax=Lithospermum erythrorhizon TaxID=34254 RepID=A0AAV3QP33_LITER